MLNDMKIHKKIWIGLPENGVKKQRSREASFVCGYVCWCVCGLIQPYFKLNK